MKNLSLTLLALIAVSLWSCSSDDEPTINETLMESISRGDKALCYESAGWDMYHDYGNGWEYFDRTGWYGFHYPGPQKIIIQSGRILTSQSYSMYSSNSYEIFQCLAAYQTSTKKKFDVYLSSPFEYDKENGTMVIEGQDFHITGFSEKAIYAQIFGRGWDYKGQEFKSRDDLTYTATQYTPVDLEKNLVGTSMDEIYRKAIAMCREHFGSKIDLTVVYGGDVILDAGNIIDLDELERELGL